MLPLHNSKWYGQSEANLRKVFEEAEKNAPSIIFIDEIDAIAPKREEVSGEVERRVVSQILTLMDGLKSRGKVIVIAATNRENAIDPALRRPGRFDREIEIGVPDQKGRKEILQIHTRNMPLTDDVDLNGIAQKTYGFVGADLEALAKEAAMAALRRNLPEISWKKTAEIPPETLEKLRVTKADFNEAWKMVEPSAMREVMIEIPNVTWKDVGGLHDVKEKLREMIEWPLMHKAAFKRIGIQPATGILLFGPPGTGKTMLAKAAANEAGANFISVKGPEVFTKWVGESERKIREIFRRAKQVAPAIIFFDEIDAVAPRRGLGTGSHVSENVVSQILTEMSGLEELHDVVVIAATNRPDIIDPALLRPGRFDRQVLVPVPDEAARLEILKIHTRNMPLAKDIDLKSLAQELENYTGADIEALIREAGLQALRESFDVKQVNKKHLEAAKQEVRPSVTPDVLKFYDQISGKLKEVDIEPRKKAKEMSYVG
ncbi:MAG: AAA family ATPase [Nanoarchaeota archaeon]|nr:AAA family ATPase [Nanoarchaeota archaeon]